MRCENSDIGCVTTPNNSFALQCYCNNASHEWFSPLFSLHLSCNMVIFIQKDIIVIIIVICMAIKVVHHYRHYSILNNSILFIYYYRHHYCLLFLVQLYIFVIINIIIILTNNCIFIVLSISFSIISGFNYIHLKVKVKSSMAKSLPVENLLPQNVGLNIKYLQ